MNCTLITESQATQKWCPFARVLLPVNQAGNRISTFHLQMAAKQAERGDDRDFNHYRQQANDCKCLASGCMAWRWAGYRRIPSAVCAEQDEAHGYCGLAGNPTITIGVDHE